jgi:3-methyladenine DNA glycosylase AlkD
MPAHAPLITALRRSFVAHADASRAPQMQAYMKSPLPFHGLPAPLRRQLTRAAVLAHPAPDAEALAATMLQLWREAGFREERYAASELVRFGTHRPWLAPPLLPVFEEMIARGAWWDHCDGISGDALGPLLHRHPAALKPIIRRWSQGADLWLRRAAFLCQRGLKDDFDAELFYASILPSIGDGLHAEEFFIRKGLGWALRERSKRAPQEVRAFCAEYAGQLAPLTVREALRAVRRQDPGCGR